jgi:hypothetical protein
MQTMILRNWKRDLAMQGQNRVDQVTDKRVRLDREWGRHRFADDVPELAANLLNDAVSSVKKKDADQY